MAYSQRNYPPQRQISFHGLTAGVKYRIRVRAVDGQGNVGPYSDSADIIAGLGDTSQPSTPVSGLSVADRTLGVDVQWSEMSGAHGYMVFATSGSTPPDPDPSNLTHLVYKGRGNKTHIKAEADYIVKVLVIWYDEFGRKSTGQAAENGKALAVS